MGPYFNGYYFKCSDSAKTVAFIPAFHSDGKKRGASLQIITNDNVYVIPYAGIRLDDRNCSIRIGHNFFSKKGISLNISSPKYRIRGRLRFGQLQPVKYSIMGPFQYIPFMQCRHSIVSMCHSVTGSVTINGRHYRFSDADGYIEGDRGRSFPKEYIWTQCHFSGGSVMLSVADIPFFGFHFIGIIGVVMLNGKEYRIATYLGARLVSNSDQKVVVRQGSYTLCAELLQENHHDLNAPVNGAMRRTIHESAACTASYRLTHHDQVLMEFTSEHASFEFEMPSSGDEQKS